MFSDRTSWPRRQNALANLIDELRHNGRPIIDLTASNPTSLSFPYPTDKILASLSHPDVLHYRPDPRGLIQAREAVAAFYASRGIAADPSSIILTSGSSEAYAHLFRLLCNAGESVLVPSPSYPLFDYLAQINDVRTASYHLRYDGDWHIDFASMERAITPSTKAIVIVHPHNPTGAFVGPDEKQTLLALCARHHLALIVDEVFIGYGFSDPPPVSFAGTDEVPTFVLNGLSKLAGLPQLKLGWIVVSGNDGVKGEALDRLETLADTYLSVNTPVQVAAAAILGEAPRLLGAIRARVVANYKLLGELCGSESPCTLLRAQGGWYAIVKVPRILSEEEWAIRLLRDFGVSLYPGYFFDMQEEGFLVVSLLPQEEVFRDGIGRLLLGVGELLKRAVEKPDKR